MYDVEKMRFWCQKIIPLVYEDSLSYYETLCKVVKKLNEVIESVDNIPEYIAEIISTEHLQEIMKTLLVNLEKQIASANEGLSETATTDRPVGTLVWLNGYLYRATKYIDAGDRYVPNGNVEKITIEEVIKDLQLTFTDKYEGGERVASADREVGELVWFKNELLLVKEHIDEGNAYTDNNSEVVDFSKLFLAIENSVTALDAKIGDLDDLETTDKSSVVNGINSALSESNTKIGDLDDLDTSDKSSVVNGINSALSEMNTKIGDLDDLDTSDKSSVVNGINSALSEMNTKIGDLNDLDTSDKSSIVNAINSALCIFHKPEEYGALGDGLHDDTVAIQTALNAGHVSFGGGLTYLVSDALTVPANRIILGNGATIKIDGNHPIDGLEEDADAAVLVIKNKTNVVVDGVKFDLNGDSLPVYSDYTHLTNVGIIIEACSNVSITNCRFINAYTECIWNHQTTGYINISENYFKHIVQNQGLRKMNVYCVTHTGTLKVNNNFIDEDDISPLYGCCGIFMANVFGGECSYNRIINCGRSNALGRPVASICLYDSCENVDVIGNYIDSIESFVRFDSCRSVRIANNTCIINKPNYVPDSYLFRFTTTSNTVLGSHGSIVIENNYIYMIASAGPSGAIGIGTHNDEPASNFIIRNNFISSRGQDAIRIYSNVSNTLIEGNHITGLEQQGIVHIMGGDNHQVRNNYIDYGGISVENPDSAVADIFDVDISGNQIYSVITPSIEIKNAGRVNAHDNTLKGRYMVVNNADTMQVFAHDNHAAMITDDNPFNGSSTIAHDNYYNGVLTAFV